MKSAENSSPAAKKPRGRPFQKGQSGNPGGRPASLSNLVREITKDGEELVKFWHRIFKGEEVIKIGSEEFKPSIRERMEASKQLADRGFGLPTQSLEHSGPDGADINIQINRTVKS